MASVEGAVVVAGAATTVGRSECPCAIRPMATVEMACLKINCSWLFVSSTTEYLSKERMRPGPCNGGASGGVRSAALLVALATVLVGG